MRVWAYFAYMGGGGCAIWLCKFEREGVERVRERVRGSRKSKGEVEKTCSLKDKENKDRSGP